MDLLLAVKQNEDNGSNVYSYLKTCKIRGANKSVPNPVEACNSSYPWIVICLVLEERKNVERSIVAHQSRTSELEHIVYNLKITILIIFPSNFLFMVKINYDTVIHYYLMERKMLN